MTDTEQPPAAHARVVLVDDDDLFRESLGQNLSDAGFNVRDFGSGEVALEHLLAGKGDDIVLLDWKMPGMNGIEVLRRIRQAGLEAPVIFLTVLNDQIYEEAALQGGAVDFVEKSRSFSILLKRINLILAGRKGGDSALGGEASAPDGPFPSRGARAPGRDEPGLLEGQGGAALGHRIQDGGTPRRARRPGRALPRSLRSRARIGLRRGLRHRGLPLERARLREAYSPEVPRGRIPPSTRSKTIPASGTAGARRRAKVRSAVGRLEQVWRSFAAKIFALVVIFFAVPLILYDQFRAADAEKNRLLLESVEVQGRLAAETLRPLVGSVDGQAMHTIAQTVQHLGDAGSNIKLLFRPQNAPSNQSFYYVASSPAVSAQYLEQERQGSAQRRRARPSRGFLRGGARARRPLHQPGGRAGASHLDHADPGEYGLLGRDHLQSDGGIPRLLAGPILLADRRREIRRCYLSRDGGHHHRSLRAGRSQSQPLRPPRAQFAHPPGTSAAPLPPSTAFPSFRGLPRNSTASSRPCAPRRRRCASRPRRWPTHSNSARHHRAEPRAAAAERSCRRRARAARARADRPLARPPRRTRLHGPQAGRDDREIRSTRRASACRFPISSRRSSANTARRMRSRGRASWPISRRGSPCSARRRFSRA